jgi:hypothetical protein
LAGKEYHLLVQAVDFTDVSDGFYGAQNRAVIVPQNRRVLQGRQTGAVLADDAATATAHVRVVGKK